MKTTTFRAGLIGFGMLAATLCSADRADAQATKVAGTTTRSTRTRGGGDDPNVRRDETLNDPNKPPTSEPPGKLTRGAPPVPAGSLCVDSRVDLFVKIYVDGTYAGTISPWGDSCAHYGGGEHRLYARAAFTDGSLSSWGPAPADVTPGFRWTIRP